MEIIELKTVSREKYPYSNLKYLDITKDSADAALADVAKKAEAGKLTESFLGAYNNRAWDIVLGNGEGNTPQNAEVIVFIRTLSYYLASLRTGSSFK